MKKLLLTLMSLVLLLGGCSSNSDTFTVLLSSEVESLDPANASAYSTHSLITDIYTGLTRINDENKQVMLGATNITVSDDKLTYTATLRDDMKWVDNTGTEVGNVTANDYVFGYQRMVDPNVASIYSYIFENIENASEIGRGEMDVDKLGVKALDDYTLEIKLAKPTPYFENLLAFGSYVAQPKGAYEAYGDDYATSSDTMWYSGAYYVTEYDPDYTIELKKNELYFNSDNVEVENLEYRLNADDTSRLNAFLNGEADYAEIDSIENYNTAKEEGVDHNRHTMFSYYFVLNTRDDSPTSDPNLRKALSLGFDRTTVVNSVFEGMNTPIEYIIPENLTPSTYDGLEYRDIAGDSLTSYDADAANKYFDKYMEENNIADRSDIELDYLVNSDTGDMDFAEVVQEYYKSNYGITINIVGSTGSQYSEMRRNGGFDILYTDWAPDYGDPSTYLALWKSDNIGSQNYASYDNSDYDSMYEQANNESDPETRFELFAKCEKKLVDDGVLVPLYQKNQPYLLNSDYEYPEFVIFLLSHEYLHTV